MDQSHIAGQMVEVLQKQLAPTLLSVLDESSDHAGHVGVNGSGYGTHFRVRIATAKFDGLTRVAKHRLVYDSLQDFIDRGVHAIAIEIA